MMRFLLGSLGISAVTALRGIQCGLDPKINADTFDSYRGEIGDIFASGCGRNRGIFVLDPPDGHTYSCGTLPEAWGVKEVNQIRKMNDTRQAVQILDMLIESIYGSSPQYKKDSDPGTCDFEAMSALTCYKELPWQRAPWVQSLNFKPIRAVNLAGLFVLEKWVTPELMKMGLDEHDIDDQYEFSANCGNRNCMCNSCELLQKHWQTFYTQEDFMEMASVGINTVRITVGWWYFAEITSEDVTPYVTPEQHLLDEDFPITAIIHSVNKAGLKVILNLSPITEKERRRLVDKRQTTVKTAEAMAYYLYYLEDRFDLTNVIILEISTDGKPGQNELLKEALTAIRRTRTRRNVLLPADAPFPAHDHHTWVSKQMYFMYEPGDIASDYPEQDRLRMFTHEKIACGMKADLHFSTCTKKPVFVSEFSFAIENCFPNIDENFKDYGQCAHLKERQTSPWWDRHYRSLAMRQIATYERELGWAFMTYKLEAGLENSGDPSVPFWSFKAALKKGYIDLSEISVPPLVGLSTIPTTEHPSKTAADPCAHAPVADFVKGDKPDNTTQAPLSSEAASSAAPSAAAVCVWNGDVTIDNSTAQAHVDWLVANKGMSQTAAQQKVMAEYPSKFTCTPAPAAPVAAAPSAGPAPSGPSAAPPAPASSTPAAASQPASSSPPASQPASSAPATPPAPAQPPAKPAFFAALASKDSETELTEAMPGQQHSMSMGRLLVCLTFIALLAAAVCRWAPGKILNFRGYTQLDGQNEPLASSESASAYDTFHEA